MLHPALERPDSRRQQGVLLAYLHGTGRGSQTQPIHSRAATTYIRSNLVKPDPDRSFRVYACRSRSGITNRTSSMNAFCTLRPVERKHIAQIHLSKSYITFVTAFLHGGSITALQQVEIVFNLSPIVPLGKVLSSSFPAIYRAGGRMFVPEILLKRI